VHSLVKVLSLYDVTLNFVSPPSLAMPDSVKAEATRANVRWSEHHNLDDVIAKSDVLYATRVQKERFDDLAEYEAIKDMFVINNDVLVRAKESAIVMHPLPRLNEIDPEVDFDSRRAAYFRQMRYGLFVSYPSHCEAGLPVDVIALDTYGASHAGVGRMIIRCAACLLGFVDVISHLPTLSIDAIPQFRHSPFMPYTTITKV